MTGPKGVCRCRGRLRMIAWAGVVTASAGTGVGAHTWVVPLVAIPPRPPGFVLARGRFGAGRVVLCRRGAAGGLRVTIRGVLSTPAVCRRVEVVSAAEGLGRTVLLAIGARSFWAVPRGAARGTVAEALGPGVAGRFRTVTIAVGGRDLDVTARARGPAAQLSYRFRVRAGRGVDMRVAAAWVFTQAPPPRWGLPALASFYHYGVGGPMPPSAIDLADHGADGLWIAGGRHESWVPLTDPRAPLVWTVGAGSVRAFGLLQRDRRRDGYGVHAARLRDAADVRACVGRGTGDLILEEWPAAARGRNVRVVYNRRPGLGRRRGASRYRLSWTRGQPRPRPTARVVSSLVGGDAPTGARKYVIDYVGGALAPGRLRQRVRGHVQVRPDTWVTQDTVGFNPYTGGYRQVVQVLPVAGQPVHIRAWLTVAGATVSEIWRAVLSSPRIGR